MRKKFIVALFAAGAFLLLIPALPIHEDLVEMKNTAADVLEKSTLFSFEFPLLNVFFGEFDDIPAVREAGDHNSNGVNDVDDIIAGARAEAQRRPVYKSAYYQGGYPPENEGVCTDVIWRAFRHAGYDLKKMVDADIRAARSAYRRIGGKPDPNIDFRRVPNLAVFFSRHAKKLGTEIKPGVRESVAEWQGGDIVVFKEPDHIGILSDKRNRKGVPYLIHNAGPWAREENDLTPWVLQTVIARYRWVRK